MQVTQADDQNTGRVGVEEEFIKFRPSPNFKNMKKFLKSRSDFETTTSLASHSAMAAEEAGAGGGGGGGGEPAERKEVKPVPVQPPLPNYPPPPDSPPALDIVIKQEKEDDDARSNPGEPDAAPDQAPPPPDQPPEQTGDRPKKTICKEFIRGNCKRAVCKFAHKIDVNQLEGVFTFCWNYQNAVCTYPNCRFVHATVFEEQQFYRTGILPPHARSHLKQPLPPPPPPKDGQQPPPSVTNPPPAVFAGVDKPLGVISCVPAAAMEAREEEFRGPPRAASPPKREWSDIADFGRTRTPRELDAAEQLAKKCKNCDIVDLSVEYYKKKIEELIQDINKNVSQSKILQQQNAKLMNVLALLKPAAANKSPVSIVNNGLVTLGPLDVRKTMLLQQLNSIVDANRLTSVVAEDSLKSSLGGGALPQLVARLLWGGSPPASPAPESSREA